LLHWQIGNKRLKVQHKQIRGRDLQDQDSLHDSFGGNGEGYPRFPSLPPSGANANQHLWYDTNHSGDDDEEVNHHLLQDREAAGEGSPVPLSERNDDHEQESPLATLGQLQSVLPDISGSASPE
jgi:hypothetical protein